MAAGEIAAMADTRKCSKYSALPTTHFFVPLAIGPKSLKTLGKCLRRVSGDSHAATYLLQHLSVAVQRGNVASILGALGSHCFFLIYLFIYLFIMLLI